MKHKFLGAAALVAAATAAAGNATAATHAKTLTASVSDPLNISLKQGTKKVSTLRRGRYVIVVHDRASDHNFHLSGPGVNKLTSVGGQGTFRWIVTLRKGTYTYVCDPHAAFMKGSFTVK
jgi:plastocyanin